MANAYHHFGRMRRECVSHLSDRRLDSLGQPVAHGARAATGLVNHGWLAMAQNEAPTPVILSPAIKPAAKVIANWRVRSGQR